MLISYLFGACFIGELFLKKATGDSAQSNTTIDVNLNNTPALQNGTVLMSRITQPSEPLVLQKEFRLGDSDKNSTNDDKQKAFVPSPLIEEYQYNKVPVKPAIPEAKAFKDVSYNTYEKPGINPWDQTNWKGGPGVNDWRGGNSWNKVRFPTNTDTYGFASKPNNLKINSKYQDASEGLSFKKPYDGYTQKTPVEGYSTNRPADFPKKGIGESYGAPGRTGLNSPHHKTFMDYNLMEKPSYYEEEVYYPTNYGTSYEISVPHKGQQHGVYVEEYGGSHGPVSTGYSKSPWKKIIKFLATVIPIGLLISALTPNIINIHNNTDPTNYNYKSKYRNEDSVQQFSDKLSSSIQYFNKLNEDGCEDKVLCELLVSASLSKHAEDHVQALLDNFVKQEDIKNKKESLVKIFDAVKKEDCSPIQCENRGSRR